MQNKIDHDATVYNTLLVMRVELLSVEKAIFCLIPGLKNGTSQFSAEGGLCCTHSAPIMATVSVTEAVVTTECVQDYEYYNKALQPTVCKSSWVTVYKDYLDILQQHNAPSLKVIISHDN